MRGFVDLHSHWIAGIDDGARSPADGIAMLAGLYEAGFSTVVATPHMRPGMFDNDRPSLEHAYAAMQLSLVEARARGTELPAVHLASEHFFDDIVWSRLSRGEGLAYPGGGAVLVEFSVHAFPVRIAHRLVDLKRGGLVVILAHPERYHPVWADDSCLDAILDAGGHLLLDVCALIGKYGRVAQAAAEKLLREEAYEAACSDAHKPGDVPDVKRAIARLEELVGQAEAVRLLAEAPAAILAFSRAADDTARIDERGR
jgi:protein-tyrosine phosphatase